MTDSLFEAISEDEFLAEQGVALDSRSIPGYGVDGDISDRVSVEASRAIQLTWCEFCKGYYNFEYHFGERG